jgi:hypothetical protein
MQGNEQPSTGFDARRLIDVDLDVLGVGTKVLCPPRQLTSGDVRCGSNGARRRSSGGCGDGRRLRSNGRRLRSDRGRLRSNGGRLSGDWRWVSSSLLALAIPYMR